MTDDRDGIVVSQRGAPGPHGNLITACACGWRHVSAPRKARRLVIDHIAVCSRATVVSGARVREGASPVARTPLAWMECLLCGWRGRERVGHARIALARADSRAHACATDCLAIGAERPAIMERAA